MFSLLQAQLDATENINRRRLIIQQRTTVIKATVHSLLLFQIMTSETRKHIKFLQIIFE